MPGADTPAFRRRADGAPTYARGKKWAAWPWLALPFTLVIGPLLVAVWRRVSWRAALLTILIFEALMLPVEHDSLLRGHWVYNENRIWGPLLWGIPIEEPLIYYLAPPLLAIALFEWLAGVRSGAIRMARHATRTARGVAGHVRRRRRAYGLVAALGATLPFVASPVLGMVENAWTSRFGHRVLLRYRLQPGRTGVTCFNVGDDPVHHVTVEVTLAAPAAPGAIVIHVPRRAEAVIHPPAAGSPHVIAVRLDRLFPRETSTDEEYITITTGVPITGIQFVADEGRGAPEGGRQAGRTADDLPPLPALALE